MRLNGTTIPSEFLPQDTNVDAADSYANVHTHRTLRLNHNILFAQRVRQPLMTQAFSVDTSFKSRYPVSNNSGPLLVRMPLYVTQSTKRIRVRFRAEKTALDGGSSLATHPMVYAGVRFPRATLQNIKSYSAQVTAANGSPANYYIDINVPSTDVEESYYAGRTETALDIYVQCQIDTTNIMHSGFSFTDIGPTWFTASTPGTGHDDDIVYSATSPSNLLRKIVKTVDLGGGSYKYFIDQPWTLTPDVTADTLTIREILGINLHALSVYELPITDYSEGYEI